MQLVCLYSSCKALKLVIATHENCWQKYNANTQQLSEHLLKDSAMFIRPRFPVKKYMLVKKIEKKERRNWTIQLGLIGSGGITRDRDVCRHVSRDMVFLRHGLRRSVSSLPVCISLTVIPRVLLSTYWAGLGSLAWAQGAIRCASHWRHLADTTVQSVWRWRCGLSLPYYCRNLLLLTVN